MHLGEINKTRFGTVMKIIEENKPYVTVEFQDDFKHRLTTLYSNFIKSQVKNPFDKSIANIGYFGVGKYESLGREHAREYDIWRLMLLRCYNEGSKKIYPAYYHKCTVCEEWHNFQTFAEWYTYNYYEVNERLHIDKDILIQGNKIYSPENCLLVPQRINMLFLNRPNKRGLPNGIRKTKHGFSALYNHIELGNYDTLEEAFYQHSKAKVKNIQEVAEEYKDKIPIKLFEALINYTPILECDKNYISESKSDLDTLQSGAA